ncbi:MAG: BMP family protein [Cyanobacteria bacterium P01_H01_bin.150]
MSMNLNRRKFISYCTAVFSGSLLLKACSNNNQTSTTINGDEAFKIAIALPGAITDKTWNQSGYEGIQLARRELNAETAFLEQVPQAEQTEVLTDFARKNHNIIFAHGGQFDAAIQQVAPQFPNIFFVGVNGAVKGDNIAALRINHQQASYLCGIVAASMTKSNQLAYIAGQKFAATEEEVKGFESGAKSVKPEIKVTSTFTGDWNDASKAKEATLALISAGADVIYQWLDNASPAVLQTAAEKNVYAFGNTKDQLEIAPTAVLTSAVKRMDLAIAYIAELAKNKQLKGDIYKIGLEKSDILSLGKFGEMVPEDVRKKAMDIKQEILDNKIKIG